VRWLVIAGPVSGYTFELFRHVRQEAGVDVCFVRAAWESSGAHAHDTFVAPDFPTLVWPGPSIRELRDFILYPAPDAVLVYGTFARLPIVVASLGLPPTVPVLFVADVNIADLSGQAWRTMFRAAAHRVLLGRATGALSLGLTNRLALEILGARRVLDAPFYAVDYSRFGEMGPLIPPTVDGRLSILLVARHVPEKNLVPFATAVARSPSLARNVHLVFVGDGPERPVLKQLVDGSPTLSADILGPLKPDRLGPLFRQAAALALPSAVEPWGNVVTEALGMGVPVVCSPAVGAGVSLAGLTQAVVVADDPSGEAMCKALARFVDRLHALREAARAAAPIVRARYDMRAAASRMLGAVQGLNSGSERPR
jgi:glycosyltransferase involved in cell wall biosynthesis